MRNTWVQWKMEKKIATKKNNSVWSVRRAHDGKMFCCELSNCILSTRISQQVTFFSTQTHNQRASCRNVNPCGWLNSITLMLTHIALIQFCHNDIFRNSLRANLNLSVFSFFSLSLSTSYLKRKVSFAIVIGLIEQSKVLCEPMRYPHKLLSDEERLWFACENRE